MNSSTNNVVELKSSLVLKFSQDKFAFLLIQSGNRGAISRDLSTDELPAHPNHSAVFLWAGRVTRARPDQIQPE